jgi:uncharacterized membrane protein YhaH (DUF805 family)
MTVYLEDNRRELFDWIGKIQHLAAGIPLLLLGLRHLGGSGDEGKVFACIEILIASAVLISFALELRVMVRRLTGRHASAAHSHFGWFDLAAAVLLLFEAFHGVHTKPFYQRAHFYAGSIALVIGLLHRPFLSLKRRRRSLTLDDTGLDLRLGLTSRVKVKWSALKSLECGGDTIVFNYAGGRTQRIKLTHISNRAAACEVLVQWATQAGLPAVPTQNGGQSFSA